MWRAKLIAGLVVLGPLISSLQADMNPLVKCEGSRVWIENIACPRWGQGADCTFDGALCTILQFLGDNVSYDDLMGWSGQAFRFQLAPITMEPSAACAQPGFDTSRVAKAALDRELIWLDSGDDDPSTVEKRRAAIVASIDEGKPVLYVFEECGIIVGYEDNGKRFLYLTYLDKSDCPGLLEKWSWASAAVIGNPKRDPMSRRQKLIQSLKTAQQTANTPTYGNYVSGFRAYEVWIELLLDDSRFNARDESGMKDIRVAMLGNAYCYRCLIDARASAARYLRNNARDVAPDVAPHLLRAANSYDAIALKLGRHSNDVPSPFEKKPEQWTREMRSSQAAQLRDALTAERQAIAEFGEALKLLSK